ncbi:prevent-host-death protein [Leptodesmis sp.]|uniref:prevent-host-death protein n=1 Tax=Leptodesmis sp. TaxID=3100501 RepID=UPI0040534779
MQSYPLKEIRDRQQELLEQAEVEPVFLTEGTQPKYVVLSAQDCQQLIVQLSNLEEIALGQLAETALNNSFMVGSETFMAELQRLAAIENYNR